jgi:hypothetical protein
MEDGLQKKVTEQYVVDALSFSEAEKRIIEEMSAYISGEFEVTDVKKAQYKEVFFMSEGAKMFHNEVDELNRSLQKGDKKKAEEVFHRPLEQQNNLDSRWYKAKLAFITIDEKTEKEKRSAVVYLVEATSLDNAVQNINTVMQGTMIDYEKSNIAETKIMDVFEYVQDKAAELMDRMAEELKDRNKTVEEIADKYVKTATPELRRHLIDKLTAMRENGQIPQK